LDNANSKISKKAMEIVFWGTIFSLTMAFIGGLVIAFGKYNQDKNSSNKSSKTLANTEKTVTVVGEINEKSDTTNFGIDFLKQRNKILAEQIDSLQTKLLKSNLTISELAQQNADLSIKLSDKAQKIYGNVTGGDSYFSTLIYEYNDRPNQLYFHGIVESDKPHTPAKFPLSDVSIEVYQSNNLIKQIPPKTYGVDIDYNLGDLIFNPNLNFDYFQIRIFTPKRNYWQHLFLKRHSNGKLYSHIIQDDEIYGINIRNNEFFGDYPNELKKVYPTPNDYAKELMKEIPEDVKKHFRKKETE
jgi:hypothetical protein